RFGHNEGDEPSFTQPDLYAKIHERPSVAQRYKKELIEAGTLSDDEAASLEAEFEMRLELVLQEVRSIEEEKAGGQARFRESTAVFQPQYCDEGEPTTISPEILRQIVDGLTAVPENFNVIPKIRRTVLDRRREVFEA